MRPLKELLPIVRTFLWDGTVNPERHLDFDSRTHEFYVCCAAWKAQQFKQVSKYEADSLVHLVMGEIAPHTYLKRRLVQLGRLHMEIAVSDVDYIPVRDRWLDELQTALEQS